MAVGVDLPRQPQSEMQFLSAEELQWLADGTTPPYGTLILFLGYGGLRWGEAISLRRSRCDLLRARVEVAETLSEVNGKWHWGEPKTYQRRTVVLPAFLKERLAAHLAVEVDGDSRALVFTSPTGKRIRHGWFCTRVWKPALEGARLPLDVRIHDLRHTSASLLISQGVHPRAVQAHLGHSSIAVTMDRYGHLFPSECEAIAGKLEALHDRAAARAGGNPLRTKGIRAIDSGLQNPVPGFGSRRRLHRSEPLTRRGSVVPQGICWFERGTNQSVSPRRRAVEPRPSPPVDDDTARTGIRSPRYVDVRPGR